MLKWRSQDIASEQQMDETEYVEGRVKGAIKVDQVDSLTEEFSFSMSDWYVRPAMILTAFAIFSGLMINAATKLWDVLDRPIEQVLVVGNTQYLSRETLVDKLVSSTQQTKDSASVFSTDLNALLQQTIEEPWVNSASIKREWPPKIAVNVEEQVPIAKWGGKGLLNHQGDIFWPESRDGLAFLPILDGPSTETARVMNQYHTLNQFFKGSDSFMKGLTLQARGAWTILLGNNIEVELGREKVLARLKRFLELYKGHLYTRADQIEQIDVRYTNGVAVKWRASKNEPTQ